MNNDIQAKILTFARKFEKRHYLKNSILIFAHEEPDAIFFLESGTVEQYDVTTAGNKVAVNLYREPAFFPMSWALNRTPNTFVYSALTDVVVYRAHPDETVKFIEQNPDVLLDLMKRVYKGTDALLQRLVYAAGGMASSRLVYELLLEAHRFGKPMPDDKIVVKVKQNVLANRSGMARETVSRELHKLEHDKLVQKTPEGLLLDINALQSSLLPKV